MVLPIALGVERQLSTTQLHFYITTLEATREHISNIGRDLVMLVRFQDRCISPA